MKIHAGPITKHGEIGAPLSFWFDFLQLTFLPEVQLTEVPPFPLSSHFLLSPDYEAIVKLSDGFNGADLRNVCTEAGKKCHMQCNVQGVLKKALEE